MSPVDGMRVAPRASRRRVAAAARHRRRAARPRRVHREIRRDAGRPGGARASPPRSSTGAARAAPTAICAQRERGHVRPGRGLSGRSRRGDGPARRSCGCPARYLMLAHSMGGHIGLRYLHAQPGALRRRGDDRADVRHPPASRRRSRWPAPSAGVAIALGAGRALRARPARRRPRPLSSSPRNRLTSCAERISTILRQHVAATPELALGGVTYGWLGAALRSIALTRRPGYLEAITTPILVCQAGRERIVSAIARRSRRCGGCRGRGWSCSPRPGTSCCCERDRSAGQVFGRVRCAFADEVIALS